jgi:lysophospholipase L1-like esterase
MTVAKSLKILFFWVITVACCLILLEAGLRALYYTLDKSEFALATAWTDISGALGHRMRAEKIDIPESILRDLTKHQAVIGNSNNPTRAERHNTILVRPDSATGYVLRENTRIINYKLKSTLQPNWDLPTLSIKEGSHLGDETLKWIEREAYYAYEYSIDQDGHRTTLPTVASTDKVLIVGDSVAFGSGVGDEQTSASQLQARLGDDIEVVNAAVGGYNGEQVSAAAERARAKQEFELLVYIACQNDFDSAEDVSRVFAQLGKLSESFPRGVIIVLTTYMEFSNDDFVVTWRERLKQTTRDILERAAFESKRHGFLFLNWDELVQAQVKMDATPYAIFSLYVDHVHFSPKGNRRLAEVLAREIEGRD